MDTVMINQIIKFINYKFIYLQGNFCDVLCTLDVKDTFDCKFVILILGKLMTYIMS